MKEELLQIRVEPELKKKFYELAAKKGHSPSALIRSFMVQAVENERLVVHDVEEDVSDLITIQIEIMKYLQDDALHSRNEKKWQLYSKSFIPEYLDQQIGTKLRKDGFIAKEFWKMYWKNIEESWHTDFGETKPSFSVHLSRETMKEIRNKALKERTDG